VLHYNQVSSFFAWGLALAQIPFIVNFFWSLKHGKATEANAWQATTLEWSGGRVAPRTRQLQGAPGGLPRPVRVQRAGRPEGLHAAEREGVT
jgi:heme/copper-type cytochrome/quinol oxidase subunit 1